MDVGSKVTRDQYIGHPSRAGARSQTNFANSWSKEPQHPLPRNRIRSL